MTTATKPTAKREGLECRRCGCRHFLTLYTRHRGDAIQRRKECRYCGLRIFTREKAV